MAKLNKDDMLLLCFQVFVIAFCFTSQIMALLQGDFTGSAFLFTAAGMTLIFVFINIDRWTEKGKLNKEFFSQHVF